jgi:hypothetical protein
LQWKFSGFRKIAIANLAVALDFANPNIPVPTLPPPASPPVTLCFSSLL